MNKLQHIIPLLLAWLFVACAGEEEAGVDRGIAVAFNTSATFATRAGGQDAASVLGNKFTVYGSKKIGDAHQLVFPGYEVRYTDGSANTSHSNTAGWDYVWQEMVGGNVIQQTIKYWDFKASQYDFVGYAYTGTGLNVDPTYSTDNQLVESLIFRNVEAASANKLFYTHPKTIGSTDIGKAAVGMEFQELRSYIRIGFYEALSSGDNNIHVHSLKFHKPNAATVGLFDSDEPTATPYLSGNLPSKGDITVSYDYTNHTSTTSTTGTGTVTCRKEMGTLAEGNLPTSSASAKFLMNGESQYFPILPFENNDQGISLKIDYSVSQNAVVFTERGKVATIPAQYCKWKPNYSYTYIFKINEMGNIALFDVQVADWQAGETQEDEWHNW